MSRFAKTTLAAAILICLAGAALVWAIDGDKTEVMDRYQGVAIYNNGPIAAKGHGRHYSPDGYYWGQKWQCVEFVKRFYDQAKGHRMPDVWGHAKDFFDPTLPQGTMNTRRGMMQFRNGENEPPKVDDLLVFDGPYGHVAIVREVGSNYVVVAQQNIYRKPRQRFETTQTNDQTRLGPKHLLGWLRLPSPKSALELHLKSHSDSITEAEHLPAQGSARN